jgi:hypothetical protein
MPINRATARGLQRLLFKKVGIGQHFKGFSGVRESFLPRICKKICARVVFKENNGTSGNHFTASPVGLLIINKA